MKQILCKDYKNDKRLTVRPTLEQMREFNIRHYKGKQFRYIYFLCGKTEKKRLLRECLVNVQLPRPKNKDLWWRIKNVKTGKWVFCDMPDYKTDLVR